MKLEEIIPFIRQGKKIEYLVFDRNNCKVWGDLILEYTGKTEYEYNNFTNFSFNDLLDVEFRLKKEKVKKYQVLYFGESDKYYHTTIDFYKNEEDFKNNFPFNHCKFDSLIFKSEKEYDE